MVQPNTEARPRRARTRRGEEQAPLVESQLSVPNDVIMDGEEVGPAVASGGNCPPNTSLSFPPSPSVGIDGPAAFLGSEAPDLGLKIQIASASQQQQQQPQSPPSTEDPERNGDTEKLLEPKTDIQELLQRQGETLSWTASLSDSA